MNNKLKGFSVKIADVVIRSSSEEIALEPSPIYKSFVVNGLEPDIDIQVFCGGIPEVSPQQKIFESGGPWSLYTLQGGRCLFTFSTPIITPNLFKVAIFDADFARGEIHLRHSADNLPVSLDPLSYPLDELLVVNYLAQGRGIDIHACGIDFCSSGLAFIGVSGAGKSTLANLWKSRNVKVLSDDRLVLRKQDGCFWVYGTPWHGDARASLPDKIRLRGLYFIKQAPENRVVPLGAAEAVKRLLVRCFPPFYYVHGMEFTLEFITELAQTVPCYELQFTPDQRATEEVLRHAENLIV